VQPVRTLAKFAAPALVAATFAGAAAAPAQAAPAQAAPAGCHWNGAQPAGGGVLQAVAVLPSCEAFAVGGITSTLIMRFSDGAWTQQPSPSPDQTNALASVAATSAASAWAVGNYAPSNNPPDSPSTAEILHWNGTSWGEVKTPQPGGARGQNSLFGVAATSATNAWAVGSYDDKPPGPRHTMIVHWNGTSWRRVPSPSPGGASLESRLTSVAVVSARDAWAVGWYQTAKYSRLTLILHWNGTSWRQVPSPNGPHHKGLLFGVTATSARSAWAAGYSVPDASALILHWAGSAWRAVKTPAAGVLSAVTATSARNAWAVGNGAIMHWNGRAWSTAAAPSNALYGVSASSAGNAWAVGLTTTVSPPGDHPLVVHWNGTTWQP